MHADTATASTGCPCWRTANRLNWQPAWNALNINADYEVIRAAETGPVRFQARMGGTGERFCWRRHAPRRRASD